jgi:hypothetical protein
MSIGGSMAESQKVADTPEQWLYREGAPRSVAQAFGEYCANHVEPGTAWPAAKTAFDYDPAGRELVHYYGRVVVELPSLGCGHA